MTYHIITINLKSNYPRSFLSLALTEAVLYFVFWPVTGWVTSQSNYIIPWQFWYQDKATVFFWLISCLIWFLVVSLLCRGQDQGKATLKWKSNLTHDGWKEHLVKSACPDQRTACECDSKGRQYFTGLPQSPGCSEAGQHYADCSLPLNYSEAH